MKKSIKLLSVILALLTLLSVAMVGIASVSAADTTLSYSFKQNEAGFAEGTITLKGDAGKYYLYWADSTKALEGYREIAILNITSSSASYDLLENTVIPADAEKLIAVKSASTPAASNRTVQKAAAVYSIPASRQLPFASTDALYTFGSVGDPQIANDSYGSGSYPNDEVHLKKAFETLHARDVDFTVSSGDIVNDQNGKQTYAAEYKVYQKILAESPYANPIYEAVGNHDVGTVWDKNGNYYNDNTPFNKATGLDSSAETIKAGKPYYEITEPTTGDHFIFMALEGGFYTNKGTQFSKAQLDWLEGLLKKYSGDGKNIFIIEHANIGGWGSGDKLTTPYYYDLALIKTNPDVKRFISLMETYKECVIITAHTHLELGAHLNYSDNNDTSAVMMHNSAIGGVRRLVNGKIDRTAVLGMSEGYIVDVFEDCIVFNGINLYYNEIMPDCSYIIPFDTEALETPTKPAETEPVETEPVVTTPTEDTTPTETDPVETKPADTEPTIAPPTDTTEPSTTPQKTEPDTGNITTTATEPHEYIYGDADLSGDVNIKDATVIQKHSADMLTLDGVAFTQANVTGDKAVNVRDATAIQKFVAGLITVFPVEGKTNTVSVGAVAPEYLAKDALDKYYAYASYDQYMALKKAYLYGIFPEDAGKLPGSDSYIDPFIYLIDELEAIVLATGGSTSDTPSGDITVYFTNNYKWSSVKAYIWGSGGTKATWPGEAMTYAKTNSQGQDIYSVTFSYDDYQKIIFTDGSKQTADITLSGSDGVGYYISGESGGKYTCSTYTYA